MGRLLAACILLLVAGCAPSYRARSQFTPDAKPVSFALLEDYDKGDDLAAIASDFALLQELEITTLRCSLAGTTMNLLPACMTLPGCKSSWPSPAVMAFNCALIWPTPEWAGDEACPMAKMAAPGTTRPRPRRLGRFRLCAGHRPPRCAQCALLRNLQRGEQRLLVGRQRRAVRRHAAARRRQSATPTPTPRCCWAG